MKLGAVLMAAGAAARFGSNKLFCPVDGVPMIERAFDALPPSLFRRASVVSCYPGILALAARRGYRAVPNGQSREGQSASIRLGLAGLTDMDGVLFSVCDQPYLRRESVERLLAAFETEPGCICSLSWRGQRGSPAIFPAVLFPELLALTGEKRGGTVVKAHPELLRLVEAASPLELHDVDRPEDLPEEQATRKEGSGAARP